ncbi:hypothetical protein OKW21_001863 [Catalinimonas alkaloidigena]|uniref:DUF1206 domain-containing protein n=1 Tax=Catalinimonas alkaloidigena TaxID=1075417 RepID=UPI0024071217|nr:DUF1206 domain-containing protein [Catalinimonas alkaloidigena]MDF9796600.1 hypothetical protein [Catalinimonas alkaloidigena]
MNDITTAAKSAGRKAQGNLPETEKWVEKLARFGYASKGVIYILIGVLAAMAAFGAGGQTSGTQGIFQKILSQPFGKILLGIVAVGFVGYAVWRLVAAIKDAEHKGNDTKGILFRIGYVASGVIYGYFAFQAFKMIFGAGGGSGSGGGDGQQMFVSKLLEQPAGQWLVGIVAVAAFAKGIYQIYKGWTNKFGNDVRDGGVKREIKDLYMKLGKAGFIARGVVFAIVGFFFFKAAITASSSQAGGTDKVFSFLSSTGGPWLMGLIAIGLAGYGVFQLVKARYKPFNTN